MFSPNRIDLDDTADVLLWADNLGISVERLREIAAKVGPMAPAVRFYVQKSAGEKKPADRLPPGGAAQNASAGPVTPATVLPSITT